MQGATSARRRRGILAWCIVAGAVLVATLAVAPAAWGDPGSGQDTPLAAEAGDSRGAAPAEGDAPGSSAVAPGHDDQPGNSGAPPGHDDPPGASGDAPGHQDDHGPSAESDQGASVDQKADAAAAADQQDVDNTAATVRVDEPGNGKKVGQENRASADADASTASAVDGAADATVVQSADADASATQSDVANTSIVVRVGSPGDDEGVSQANLATGTATATTLSDQPSLATADAASLATQDGVANTTVSVRVFSPGDDGPVSQLNAATAAADTSPGGTSSAIAQQDAAQNTVVSIRVESPGSVAAPVQENRSTTTSGDAAAGSAGGVAVAMAGDGTNTVLTVAVGGAALARPGAAGAEVWEWTWVWTRDETQDLGDLTALEPDSWSWSWDGTGSGATTPHGNVTSRPADDDEQGREGSLEWSWDWTRGGVSGWTWDWNRQLKLSCTSCIWIWNWSWSWTGQPASGEQVPASTIAPLAPGQLNAVSAQATATASSQVTQTVVQAGSGAATQFAGQLVDLDQDARAVATAQQTDVSAVAWDGGGDRSNTVTSVAGTALAVTVGQRIEQLVVAADAAQADQWGGQQAELAQLGSADASSVQRHAQVTGTGTHAAASAASTDASAKVTQELRQDALSGGGTVSQWAGQLALVEQAANAATTVKQAGNNRAGRTVGLAIASAHAGDLAVVAQGAEQSTARTGGTSVQTAEQLAFAGQDATARASTDQQAAAAVGEARSGALALTRAEIVQDAVQSAGGSSFVVQDLLQQAVVVQRAVASSLSRGGIAGTAFVLDCAVVRQGATQSVGMGHARPETPADTAFCLPPEAPPTSAPFVFESSTATRDELATTVATEPVAPTAATEPVAPTTVGEARLRSGTRKLDSGPRATAHHTHRSSNAPSALAPAGPGPGSSEISAPSSPQARIDTRPERHAGAGDAGREPLLPPVGDPPSWVSALAAAASGGGASGIAAIPSAFALSTPLLLRAPEGSVVRRPTDVFAPVDVPV